MFDQYIDGLKHAGLSALANAALRIPDSLLMPQVEAKLRRDITHEPGVEYLLKMIREIKAQWGRFHPRVRERFVHNLIGNMMLFSGERHRRAIELLGDNPLLMVVSPTMRCNLKCKGCYSANYRRKDGLSTSDLDRLLNEAKQMGIYFVVLSGGEPFLRSDLLELVERHEDIFFMAYTNGTIIYRDNLAPRLAKLGNLVPCISVEGFDEETDGRRGKGTFCKIIGAMGQLRDAGVMFGISMTPMRHNNELLVTDEFIDYFQKQGAFIAWYFNYMPIGREPDLDLMPTPEQRFYRLTRIRELRRKTPLLVSDFWCDGPLVGGCLSAGRVYFHVNSEGGVEPCVFHQYWVDNIKDKPLSEALNSPYFRHLRSELSNIDNKLTPCPVIDHPAVLREAVKRFKPRPSQAGGTKTVTEFAAGLDVYASELAKIMDPIWERERPGA